MGYKPSEVVPVMATVNVGVTVASTVTSGWVDMSIFHQAMAIVFAGTIGASGTVDAKISQATDSGGSGIKDISGLAITQLTQAGSDSDKQAVINIIENDLDVAGGFTHVQLSMTVGTATSDIGGVILGIQANAAPATDATTVDEVVG